MRTNNDNGDNNNHETSSRRHRNYYRRQRSIDDIMSFNSGSTSTNTSNNNVNQDREEQARQTHYFHIISNEAFGKTSLLQTSPQLAIEPDAAVEPQSNLVTRSMHNRIDRKMFRELRMQHFQEAHAEMFENWNGEELELNNIRVSKKKSEKGTAAERTNEPKGVVLHLVPINNDLTFKEEPEDSDWIYYEDKKKDKVSSDKSKTQKHKTGRVSFV